MNCPWCGSPTKITHTKQQNEGLIINRRRECINCNKRFSTKEFIKKMMLNTESITKHIVTWLKNKIEGAHKKGFVVGVSGGIDSATVSTLCAKTGYPVMCLNMPIGKSYNHSLSNVQIEWLKKHYPNVSSDTIDLTETFNAFEKSLPELASTEMAFVNTRSRLRMITLYAFSGSLDYLVAGTGNKVEDYGIGFFTKYGDGGVDVSPIGDLKKTEVYSIARFMEIPLQIQETTPTDGLWEDGRTDEDQIGATYANLEWAMDYCDEWNINTWQEYEVLKHKTMKISEIQEKILYIYLCRHQNNRHKMEMPPVCHIENRKKLL